MIPAEWRGNPTGTRPQGSSGTPATNNVNTGRADSDQGHHQYPCHEPSKPQPSKHDPRSCHPATSLQTS